MDPTLFQYGSIALLLVNLLVVVALSRYFVGSATDAGSEPATATIDREAGTVVCPDCDTENELGYRYCGRCLAELPGATSRTSTGRSPGQRGIF